MSTLFLFGAGASFGSVDCKPEAPPLGGKLFSGLQKTGGIFATIEEPLSSIFKDGENGGFEKGMAEFLSTRNDDATRFLREMSCYFANFSPGPNNLYRQVISILKQIKRKAVFVTTNYEMLIELAAMQEGYKVMYVGDDGRNDSMRVLKIHGSCNFLPVVETNQFQGVTFSGPPNGKASYLNSDTRTVLPSEVLEFCKREDSIAPAIALYVKGKQVLFNRRFVDMQQKAWQFEARRACRIFIIGLKVNPEDIHIWEILKLSKANLYYVGMDDNDFLKWMKDEGRKRAYVLAKTFKEAIPKIKTHLNRP